MAMKTRSRGKAKIPVSESRNQDDPTHLSALVMLSQQLLSIGRFNKGLPSFVTKGVDSEQLWQQFELRNNHQLALSKCTREVVQISSRKRVKREKKIEPEEPVPAKANSIEEESGSSSDSDVDNALDAIKTRLAQKSQDEDEFPDFGSSDDEEENDFDFDMTNKKSERLLPKQDESDADEDENKSKGESKVKQRKKISKKTSAVDDKFFKMADMEEFLDAEDAKEEKRQQKISGKKSKKVEESTDEEDDEEDEEEMDLFAAGSDSDEEDDGMMAKYTDFFDPPDGDDDDKENRRTKDRGDGDDGDSNEDEEEEDITMDKEDSDESEEGDMEVNSDADVKEEDEIPSKEPKKKVAFSNDLFGSDDDEKPDVKDQDKKEVKSTFEQKQEKLLRKVHEMEELSLKEQSWELTGEVQSSKRPENSLLETVLDYQHTARTAPVITDDTTKTLEDYIKLRIKDKTFDDVERKEKPKEDVFEFKKRVVLDQEKSKQSLAEIYEQEFVKQQKKETNEVKADPQCEKIEKELDKLFYQLDALSNFRFTPMRPGTEVKIMVNTPAITLEEVAPVATADSDLLAPEEIMAKRKGELKASEERDSTDKKRARRQKKMEKKEKKKDREAREKKVEKLKPGLGNQHSKVKALRKLEELSKSDKSISVIKDEGKKLASSSAFFAQLQDEVTTNVKAVKAAKKEKKKKMNAGSLIL